MHWVVNFNLLLWYGSILDSFCTDQKPLLTCVSWARMYGHVVHSFMKEIKDMLLDLETKFRNKITFYFTAHSIIFFVSKFSSIINTLLYICYYYNSIMVQHRLALVLFFFFLTKSLAFALIAFILSIYIYAFTIMYWFSDVFWVKRQYFCFFSWLAQLI